MISTCPSEREVAQLFAQKNARAIGELKRHCAACARCREMVDAFVARRIVDQAVYPGTHAPSDDLLDLLAGDLAPERARVLEFHLRTCPVCASRVAALRGNTVVVERPRPDRRLVLAFAGGTAALAVGLLIFGLNQRQAARRLVVSNSTVTHQAPPPTGSNAKTGARAPTAVPPPKVTDQILRTAEQSSYLDTRGLAGILGSAVDLVRGGSGSSVAPITAPRNNELLLGQTVTVRFRGETASPHVVRIQSAQGAAQVLQVPAARNSVAARLAPGYYSATITEAGQVEDPENAGSFVAFQVAAPLEAKRLVALQRKGLRDRQPLQAAVQLWKSRAFTPALPLFRSALRGGNRWRPQDARLKRELTAWLRKR